jgi:hypothetical protein
MPKARECNRKIEMEETMTAEYKTIRDTPILISMSTRQYLTRIVLTLAIVTTLGALTPASVNATTQVTNFGFGPGTATPNTSNASATLNVPARTTIRVTGLLNPVSGLTIGVPVVVEVFRPGGTSPVASLTTAAAPLLVANQPSVPFAFLVETFTSQVGCPSTWRVRVRTTNNSVPSAGVTGSVTFDFQRPGVVDLDMVGDSITVPRNADRTRQLAGHDTFGVANASLIAGTGTFRIRAKWDTDLGVFPWGQFFRVNVQLLKPNGANADNESGRSYHYNGSGTKVDFAYTVTPADAAMTGPWTLRIRNTLTSGGGPEKINNFDIENFAFPSFKSTFQAACN